MVLSIEVPSSAEHPADGEGPAAPSFALKRMLAHVSGRVLMLSLLFASFVRIVHIVDKLAGPSQEADWGLQLSDCPS